MKNYLNLINAMTATHKEKEDKLMLMALESFADQTDYHLHKDLMTKLTTLYLETNQALLKTLIKVEKMATEDQLTQLHNRTFFRSRADYEIEKQKRHPGSLSLIMFDIDHFKSVNDTYGHDVGDMVLVALSKLAKDSVRKTDSLARWGGDEFVVLLPDTNLDQARVAAEQLRGLIAAIILPPVGYITCSFGVSTFQSEDTLDSFMKRADEALYDAKQTGRNKVCLA